MNLTWLYKERQKERKESDRRRRKTGENKIPSVVSGVEALSVEIRTGNCFKSITLSAPIQPFCRGAFEPKRQNLTESVCSEQLFVIPACETKFRAKNSNI